MNIEIPDLESLEEARIAFEENESRDLFYRAATELVDRAIAGESSLSVAEAISVLLQTWNQAYYRYNRFDNSHFNEIESLIERHEEALLQIRPRSIISLSASEEPQIIFIFMEFENVLGPVGASKSLHLLAPNYFPLWDRAIAKAYHFGLGRAGTNGKRYYAFMLVNKAICSSLAGEERTHRNILKAIDEYNYCKYTKHWI